MPAYTFDNVNGQFPIGFYIWNTSIKERFNKINADVYNENSDFIKQKKLRFQIILNTLMIGIVNFIIKIYFILV